MTTESSLWLKIPTSCPICFCQWTCCHFIAINIQFAHILEVNCAHAWKGAFPWVFCEGQTHSSGAAQGHHLCLLWTSDKSSQKALSAQHPGSALSTQEGCGTEVQSLDPGAGMWCEGSRMSPVSIEHFVFLLPEPNSSMPRCTLVTCSCLLQFATLLQQKRVVLSTMSTTFPPELSSPWFQGTLAVTQWFWGAAMLPLALAVLSSLGHSGDCLCSLAVLWASLAWINTHVLSTFSSLICSVKAASSGWLWAVLHTLWVLTHLLWATCFVPSLALKQQHHFYSFSWVFFSDQYKKKLNLQKKKTKPKNQKTFSLTLQYLNPFVLFAGFRSPYRDQWFSFLSRHVLLLRLIICFTCVWLYGSGFSLDISVNSAAKVGSVYPHSHSPFPLFWLFSHTNAGCFSSHI